MFARREKERCHACWEATEDERRTQEGLLAAEPEHGSCRTSAELQPAEGRVEKVPKQRTVIICFWWLIRFMFCSLFRFLKKI